MDEWVKETRWLKLKQINSYFVCGAYLYCIKQAFSLPRNIFSGLYFSKYSSCLLLIAPLRRWRIYWTASSYFIPPSISARATSTGALPRPATQWMAMVAPGLSWKVLLRKSNHDSTIPRGGAAPSSNGQSWNKNNRFGSMNGLVQVINVEVINPQKPSNINTWNIYFNKRITRKYFKFSKKKNKKKTGIIEVQK